MANHAYGWRPSHPDPRDYQYAAPIPILKALPPSVDLRITDPPFSPVWNQGSLGSCGPHSSSADITFGLLKAGKSVLSIPSRLFIYYFSRKIMGTLSSDSGVDNRSMMKALIQYGWCDETMWPYSDKDSHMSSDKFRVRPPENAIGDASSRKISQYMAVPQDLAQMKSCLAGGDPFIAGFSVFSSMESKEVARTGKVPMPASIDSRVGGHDVLVVGYSDEHQSFLFRNSWGNWGQLGYGTFPYQYLLNSQLSGDFWTIKGHGGIDSPSAPGRKKVVVSFQDSIVTLEGKLTSLTVDGAKVV